jgi:hypothetical protein
MTEKGGERFFAMETTSATLRHTTQEDVLRVEAAVCGRWGSGEMAGFDLEKKNCTMRSIGPVISSAC